MRTSLVMRSLFFVAVALVSLPALAADLSRKLNSGASFGDVLGAWGEPVDKVEKGIKRQVVWYYKDGAKVVFKDGRLVFWRPTDAQIAAEKALKSEPAVSATANAELAGETRDLVRDIAKEVPSGPDVNMPDAPAAGGNPQAISPVQPQGMIRPGAPAIAPADDLLAEEDED
ncbi:MAG: hypothetical protein ACK5Y6_00200 [Pseudomonadota bacterium]|jgi:hypothetical protein